jgi:hypothetical protein
MNDLAASRIRVLTLLLIALMLGVAVFSAIVVAVKGKGGWAPVDEQQTLMLAILAGVALAEAPMLLVVPLILRSQLRTRLAAAPEKERPEIIVNGYFGQTLVLAALFESLGLLGGVFYLIAGSYLTLIGPAIALIALSLLFPSSYRFEQFAERVTAKGVL